jgi:assimilatory nitrate reductase catalytic subunit
MLASSIVKTTCPYCGVGCGVDARLGAERLIAVSGDEQHPANFGSLCVKGSALAETMGRTGRLLAPRINNQTVDWPTAIDAVASRLSVIREAYGPNAIAFYLSGQLLTEDYYVANKLVMSIPTRDCACHPPSLVISGRSAVMLCRAAMKT